MKTDKGTSGKEREGNELRQSRLGCLGVVRNKGRVHGNPWMKYFSLDVRPQEWMFSQQLDKRQYSLLKTTLTLI